MSVYFYAMTLADVVERFPQAVALRIARELGILREYVRGDKDAIQDIARSWKLYQAIFPEPEMEPRY